ncbi:amidohydrolase 2 [Ophiobolus disseminans]|uniref:6-methylsalicylate decarboxylase n=1 Tax=Ophiobolus disseminans TaxID=1469910 RepID=A0A6A7A370_9PLEO|nr:amidohydrolase 2 [Ophiobolus disseminans]
MKRGAERRIDVHSHFLPPFYRTALAQNGHTYPDGMPAIPAWSLPAHLEMMSTANVTKSILSISSPGTHINATNPLLEISLTRECNAYAANLKQEMPEKFGFWASLPLPDVNAALQEIETAWSEKADGFGLMTNYHGLYLGDAAFDAVFDRLNDLHATVFIHPTTPCIHTSTARQALPASPFGTQYPIPIFEFFFDTARSVINLFSSGTVDRCPNVRFIIPHAGGALPPLLTRFVQFSNVVPGGRVLNATTVRRQLDTQFYFDLAGFVFDGEEGGQGQLKAFVEGFGIGHGRLLFGSDFPFTQTQFVKVFVERMRGGLEALFGDEGVRDAVYWGNAEGLLGERRY